MASSWIRYSSCTYLRFDILGEAGSELEVSILGPLTL